VQPLQIALLPTARVAHTASIEIDHADAARIVQQNVVCIEVRVIDAIAMQLRNHGGNSCPGLLLQHSRLQDLSQ